MGDWGGKSNPTHGVVEMHAEDKEFVLIENGEKGFTAQFGLNIRTIYDDEEKLFYAHCDRFGLSDYASTEKKALQGIIEVIQSFIETTIEEGNLHEVLMESGFSHHNPTPYHLVYNRTIRKKVSNYVRETFELKGLVEEGTFASI